MVLASILLALDIYSLCLYREILKTFPKLSQLAIGYEKRDNNDN